MLLTNYKKISGGVICLFILLSVLTFFPILTVSLTQQEQIQDLEQKKEINEERIKELQRELKILEQEKGDVSVKKNQLLSELNKLKVEQSKLSKDISKIRSELNKTSKDISSVKSSIKETESSIARSHNIIAKIVRLMKDKDSYTIFEFLLSEEDISSFFKSIDRLSQLRVRLTGKVFELHSDKVNLELEKADKEEIYDKLSNNIKRLKSESDSLAKITNTINTQYVTTKREEEHLTNLYKAKLELVKQLEAEIEEFESQMHFILNKEALPDIGSGILAFPLDNIVVTQLFGKTRDSQRLYISGSHSGVDIRAATGTPVYAVADGIVEGVGNTDLACRGASFGKWVFIRHNGFNLATSYGHLSSYIVSEGQIVKKGQLIAYSGNSGHTTAPHLHVGLYVSKGADGDLAAQVTRYTSKVSCPGKTWEMPVAPTKAYLDLLAYIKQLGPNNFKSSYSYSEYKKLYSSKF